VTLYPLGSIQSPEKNLTTICPFKSIFCIVLQVSPDLICTAWPTMAVLGLCWSDILRILKLAWFCNIWNHSWMTIAIDLSFSPLIQKAIQIISPKYHGIRVNTLEVISKSLGGNLLLLRCLLTLTNPNTNPGPILTLTQALTSHNPNPNPNPNCFFYFRTYGPSDLCTFGLVNLRTNGQL